MVKENFLFRLEIPKASFEIKRWMPLSAFEKIEKSKSFQSLIFAPIRVQTPFDTFLH